MDTESQCGCALIPVNGVMDISNLHLELCETIGSTGQRDKLTFISCNDLCCVEYDSGQDNYLQSCHSISGLSNEMPGIQNSQTIFNKNGTMSEMMLITLSRGHSHVNQDGRVTGGNMPKTLEGKLVVSCKFISNKNILFLNLCFYFLCYMVEAVCRDISPGQYHF